MRDSLDGIRRPHGIVVFMKWKVPEIHHIPHEQLVVIQLGWNEQNELALMQPEGPNVAYRPF